MKKQGFTLIETVVVVALTSLIMGVLGSLLVYFYKTNRYVFQQAVATLEARRGIEDTVRLVREASFDENGNYPILAASASELSFSADTDNDNKLDMVTYTYVNGMFVRTIDLANGPSTTITISNSVVNSGSTPVFRYYGASGAELSSPVSLANIASVKVTLVVELDTNQGPAPFTLSGQGTLRNSRL